MGLKTFDAVVMPSECAPQTQQGVAYFGPERIQRFISTFRKMRKAGHEICVPWGHYLNAAPHEEAFLRSRFNAGYVVDLYSDDQGRLIARCTVPPGMEVDTNGDLIDPVHHTRIREVSAGIGDFVDGDGTYWEDAILHVALTPHPVLQKHAKILPPKLTPQSLITLSRGKVRWATLYGFRTWRMQMDDKQNMMDQLDDTAITGDPNALDDPPLDQQQMANPTLNDETSQAVEMLAQLGIQLPGGTTSENFVSQLIGILAGLTAAGAKIHFDKSQLDDESAIKTESPSGMMFLSIQSLTPREKAWAAREGKRIRDQIRADCDALIAQGMPPHIVNQIKAQATRVHLSIHPVTQELGLPEVQEKLNWLKALAKSVGEYANIKTTLDRASVQESPAKTAAQEQPSQDWLEKQARRLYGTGAKPGTL
jgi:hypothetical protein